MTRGAVLTDGHALPARHVIHAVGPVWYGGARGEPALPRRACERSFAIARQSGNPSHGLGQVIRSIAFPAICNGVCRCPKRAATEVALAAMREYEGGSERVVACLFDAESRRVYEEIVAAG